MAIKPTDNEAFYREVDEELRREQISSVWQRYAWLIIGGVILLLAAIGGAIYWQHRQEVAAGEQGEALVKTFEEIQAGRGKQAVPELDRLAKEGNEGYQAAALLTKADLAVQAGDDAAAAATYKSVAENDDFAKSYRDLALIRQTAVEFDKLQPSVIVQRLQPLAQPGNPWFGSAGEMVALAYLKQGKPEQAAPIFAAMAKDQQLPASLRSRAVQMAGSLGVDAIQPSEGTGETAASKEVTE
ncbi:tetratricopeptide repeat protein [Sphingosinicella sp. LY1275]|uniref:tetratricopeptide repeat protein n=1 Tax=Sphingosinicella sp. LY1275 TaxID=3095379 RepID=UPI002ADED875|nr:tetratricopeptide repeat protein [Sphingosinicella sp. LY1275]MEA1015679.1 tetratricopeptide repeat protein [Sphingosinicella sp. LY1275]